LLLLIFGIYLFGVSEFLGYIFGLIFGRARIEPKSVEIPTAAD